MKRSYAVLCALLMACSSDGGDDSAAGGSGGNGGSGAGFSGASGSGGGGGNGGSGASAGSAGSPSGGAAGSSGSATGGSAGSAGSAGLPSVCSGASGTLLFSDDFESGALGPEVNGYRWLSPSGHSGESPKVSSSIAHGGTYSLEFTFTGDADLEDDAWSEQRFRLGAEHSQLFLRWYQYFPDGTEGLGAKFVHRDATGPDNNKFLRLWDEDYNDYNVKLGFSTQRLGDGADPQLITEHGRPGNPVGPYDADRWSPAITDAYRGRWVKFQVFVSLATASDDDGRIDLWADGVRVIENTTLPLYPPGGSGNYLKNGYLMGWANSGYTDTTRTFIDDFVIASDCVD